MVTETGWTDEFPTNEETFYWIRHKQNHADINVGLLRDRTLLLAEGATHSKAHRRWDFEYLPASPSDVEQLIQLRKAGTRMLEVLETYKERHLVPPYLLNTVADLRDALAGVDRAVTVQCADCLAWFDNNTNHTCGKQVRANRRYSGGLNV